MDKSKIFELLGSISEVSADILSHMPPDTKLSDIGVDSIRFIQFIVLLEEEFDIEVLDSDLMLSNFETVGMIFDTLSKYFVTYAHLKKVLICDCDNVLWHGIAGEEDIFTDESTRKLHEAIISLYERGILICLCSKSDTESIENAFNTIDTPLKAEHFVLSKINFSDKVTNIKEIENELGLSSDSFVFVDDSDYEIGLVRTMLPDVTAVKANYSDVSFINKLTEMFESSPSADFNRTKQYRDQKEREKEKLICKTVEEYNSSLETVVSCGIADKSHACRIAELSERTNRFNLSCVRYSKEEAEKLICGKDYAVYYIQASDKYGDMGLVGAATVCRKSSVISGFFLSCRVFGRGFEGILIEKIKEDFPRQLYGVYKRSDKNRQFENFYTEKGVLLHE